MRIALTNPFSWPEVRRGSERFLHDLACYLQSTGHDVTVIASHVGPDSTHSEDGVTHIRVRQRFRTGGGRWLTALHAFAFQSGRIIRERNFDVVHSLSYFDAFGAARALKASDGTKLVMHLVGIPAKKYFRTIPHDRLMFQYALKHADSTIALSQFAQDSLQSDFNREGILLPPPVDLVHFSPLGNGTAAQPPTILFVGDVNEQRKGAAALMRAVPLVRRAVPDVRFILSGNVSPERQAALLSLLDGNDRHSVTFLGVGVQSDLPALYRQASVTVLPAIWEAFGLVLVESLASGTPIVGCAHAGIKDIISTPEIGRLFAPGSLRGETDNIDGLAQALLEGLTLAHDPATAQACRRRAEDYGWSRLGPALERVYCA